MIHDKTLNEGDYPTLMDSIPTFSEKAVAVLKNQIEKDGQILPLLTDEGQYYFFNVLSIVDGLNETESDLIRIGSGKIVYIGKYVLKNNDYTKSHIFKLENLEKDSVFVTEAFKENIINNDLQGFDFIEVDVC